MSDITFIDGVLNVPENIYGSFNLSVTDSISGLTATKSVFINTKGSASDKYYDWSEDFSDYDTTRVVNVVNSWYTASVENEQLKVLLTEPAEDTEIGWGYIPFTDGKYLDLSNKALMDFSVSADGYPQFSIRLKDKDGNYSKQIDFTANGISAAATTNAVTTSGTTVSAADISSYLTNGDFDSSSIIGFEFNMVCWAGVTWGSSDAKIKERTGKYVLMDNLHFYDDSAQEALDNQYSEAATYTAGFSKTAFNNIWAVKNGIAATDDVFFIIRHSERGDDTTASGGLTTDGIAFAQELGQAMKSGNSTDLYGSTPYRRTQETAYYIATERDYTGFSSYSDVPYPTNMLDQYYFSTSTNWNSVSTLYTDSKDDVCTKATALVKRLCSLSSSAKCSIYISHDFLCVPLLCWATDNAIQPSISTGNNWINYMSGIAVVVHSDKTYEVYPVKAFDNGLSGNYPSVSKPDTSDTEMQAEIAKNSI